MKKNGWHKIETSETEYMDWNLAKTLALTLTLVKCHEIFNNKLLAQRKKSHDKYLVLCFIYK